MQRYRGGTFGGFGFGQVPFAGRPGISHGWKVVAREAADSWSAAARNNAFERILASYRQEHLNGSGFALGAPVLTCGQSFDSGRGGKVIKAQFLVKTNSPPAAGNATAKLWAHTGTFGSSGTPTGSALAVSDNFDVSVLTDEYQLITCTFSGDNQILLAPDTKYFTTFTAPTAQHIVVGGDSDGDAPGNEAYYNGLVPGWVVSGAGLTDCIFYLWVSAPWSATTRPTTGDWTLVSH
jgi:hypothetical protein